MQIVQLCKKIDQVLTTDHPVQSILVSKISSY